jgi:hypothetical protein
MDWMDIGCLAGCVEFKFDAIWLGLPKNVIVRGEVVRVHIGCGHGQVKTVAHLAEL